MADLALTSARVLADGRLLRLAFAASPVPAAHGLPDWRAGSAAGLVPSLATGAPLEFLASWATTSDLPQPDTDANGGGSTGGQLLPGIYHVAYALARDSDGVEEIFSPVGAIKTNPVAANPAGVGWVPNMVNVGGYTVPAGYHANVYLSTAPDGGPASMRLYKTYPAKSLKVTFDINTWLDPTRAFPAPTTLTWTVDYRITDPARVVTFGQAGVTITLPAGLIRDRFGNRTAAAASAAVVNESLVDADGFTTRSFARGAGGVTLYVAAAPKGDDARTFAQAQGPATPLATPAQAVALAKANNQAGKGAAIRLRRGDAWSIADDRYMIINFGGQDRAHPLVVEDYWDPADGPDPGTRPRIDSDKSNVFRLLNASADISHVVFRRLDLRQVDLATSGSSGAFKVNGAGTNVTFDDCRMERFTGGISVSVQRDGRYNGEVNVLRTAICDGFEVGPNHTQGLYCVNARQLLISQSVIDTCGRKTADLMGSDIWCHGLYISYSNGPAALWGNLIRNNGSYGVELRCGGTVAYNVFSGNALSIYMGYPGGWYRKNVSEKARDLSGPGGARGRSFQFITNFGSDSSGAAAVVGMVAESNFALNHRSANATAAVAFEALTHPAVPLGELVIRNNTASDGGRGIARNGLPSPASLQVNDANILATGSSRLLQDSDPTADWTWYASGRNVLSSTLPANAQCHLGAARSLAQWMAATGTEADSLVQAVTFVDPAADLGDYHARLGGTNSEADYAARLRDRPPGVWDATHDVSRAWDFYASQYRPTNLPAPGSGPWDYHGAADYRGIRPPWARYRIHASSGGYLVTAVR